MTETWVLEWHRLLNYDAFYNTFAPFLNKYCIHHDGLVLWALINSMSQNHQDCNYNQFNLQNKHWLHYFVFDILSLSQVSVSRLQNVVISQAPDNNTLVSLVILPSSGGNRRDVERTSTELVALISQLSQNSSSASNALLQLLLPESVWWSTKRYHFKCVGAAVWWWWGWSWSWSQWR